MNLKDKLGVGEVIGSGYSARVALKDDPMEHFAMATIAHRTPTRFVVDESTGERTPLPIDPNDPTTFKLLSEETVHNLITNVGRAFIHKQAYDLTGLLTNGLNYIGLSVDATLTETSASTTLSTEIAANGLSRAQGAVTPATGAGTITTIDKTFTCATAPQAAAKAALFNLVSAGVMNHVLLFTSRSLQIGDTLQITFSITIA